VNRTSSVLLTPVFLAVPPNIHRSRPKNCPRCHAVATPGRVGLHGDGLRRRFVFWPVRNGLEWRILLVPIASRRFWCPACHRVATVAHPGVGPVTRYAIAAIALVLHAIAPRPIGQGRPPTEIFEKTRHRELPASERARSGVPRWRSAQRWIDRLSSVWMHFVPPPGNRRSVLSAFVTWPRSTMPIEEWLGTVVDAHGRGGPTM
jgi:hypothetical protein